MSHKIMYCYVRLSKCQALKYKLYISCLTTSSEFLPNCMYIHFCYFNKRKEVKQFTSHIPGHELENVKTKFEISQSGQTDYRYRAPGQSSCFHPVMSLSISPGRDSLINVPFPFVVFWRTQWRAVGSTCCNNYKKNVCDHRQTSQK